MHDLVQLLAEDALGRVVNEIRLLLECLHCIPQAAAAQGIENNAVKCPCSVRFDE